MLAGALIAHLAGDYVFQSDWMATEKAKKWWPAVVHGVAYTLSFVLLTHSPWALLVIGGTHIVLDHYQVARYVIWAKNQIAPQTRRVPWRDATVNCGFPVAVAGGLASALLIVVDNTMHLAINAVALLTL